MASTAAGVATSYRVAAWFTLGAVVLGSAVCATESGLACPTWPGCFPDQVTPDGLQSAIEFTHRVVAFGSLVTLGVAAWHGRRLPDARLRWFPVAALVAAVASGVFGMTIVLFGLPVLLGLLDVAAALVALCLITFAAVRVQHPGRTDGLGRLGWATAAVVIAVYLLGIVVAGDGSLVRCLGWPVWRIVDGDLHPPLQWARLGLGGVAAALVAVVVLGSLRRPVLRRSGAVLGVAWLAELALGQVIVTQFTGGHREIVAAAVYSMLAGTILWLLARLAARATGGVRRTGR